MVGTALLTLCLAGDTKPKPSTPAQCANAVILTGGACSAIANIASPSPVAKARGVIAIPACVISTRKAFDACNNVRVQKKK